MSTPFKTLSEYFKKPKSASRLSKGSQKSADIAEASRLYRQRSLLVVLTILILSVVMSVHLMPDKISLRLGDISPREITAHRSVIYVNSVATSQATTAGRLSTPPIYDKDERAEGSSLKIANEMFDRLDRSRAKISRSGAAVTAQETHSLQAELGSTISEAQVKSLLSLSPGVFQKLRATTVHSISEVMQRDIKDQSDVGVPSFDLRHARLDVTEAARDEVNSEEERKLVETAAQRSVQPNLLLNRHKTEGAREAAARTVPPIYGRIVRGDTIINAGDHVTQEQLDKSQGLGLLDPRLEIQTGAAICILAASMVLLVSAFVRRTLIPLYTDMRRLSLLSFIVLMSVMGLKVGATMLGLQFTGGQFGYLAVMSVSAAGMLVSVLIDTQLAVLVVALLSVLSGLVMNHEIQFTVMTLMSSLVGIGTCRTARTRNNLLRTSVILSCANLGLGLLMGMLLRDSRIELLTGSYWAVLMGFAATSIFWFGVLAFEKPFGILTHQTLLEMSSSDRPLLQQLCAVAPGTYAHSIMVGTLAEAGAQAIGADSLLCRVGGYYHDIGKMKRPDFFVENQRNGNVHGRLSPSLSAIFITAHVKDGLQMAKEHNLPSEIRDIISSHHGTTLIGYFYHQALTDCGGSDEAPPGLEERFRYPGPRPQTREAAVVMLADSVEAATRCLDRPHKERLQAEILRIVRGKIEDGQFDDCSITFKDIRGITEAFVHVLEAMMHGRVSYPKLPAPQGSGTVLQATESPTEADELVSLQALPSLAPQSVTDERATSGIEYIQARKFQNPEEFYASFGDEPAINTGSNENPSTGRESTPASRAIVRRRSQRSTDQ